MLTTVSIINVNVLFLSNSQQGVLSGKGNNGVNYQCQCSLFKQFTTSAGSTAQLVQVSIINVNVLFLSNSQQDEEDVYLRSWCQLSMSMFSF